MENKENILERFINFIKRIFGKEEVKQIAESTEEVAIKQEEPSFLDRIRVVEEDDAITKLQKDFEKNATTLSSMSDEEIHELNMLYKKQIRDLRKTLSNRRAELNLLQHKINIISANP